MSVFGVGVNPQSKEQEQKWLKELRTSRRSIERGYID